MNHINQLNSVLQSFRIAATCIDYSEQNNSCHYDLKLEQGGQIRGVRKYLDELSLALKISGKAALKVLSEQGLLRLEFVKPMNTKIKLFEMGHRFPRPSGKLTCLLGETLEGKPLWFDLAECPHLLVAGCSGSGKSTLLHTILANLLLHPLTEMVLLDPKQIEFVAYEDMARMKVAYDYQDCLAQIEALVVEMETRYLLMRDGETFFPYKVLMVDEFADLMMQDQDRRFYNALCRLSQKARAANIHLILSTQRPSVDVVSGTIKANFPARISCKVSSGIDSRVILDATGAQHLRGAGDAILKNQEHECQRFQVASTSPAEIKRYLSR